THELRDMDSIVSVSNNANERIEELAITLDQDALFENQLSASEVADTFNSLTTGMNVFTMLDESTEEYLMVRMALPEEEADSEEALGNMVISRSEDRSEERRVGR